MENLKPCPFCGGKAKEIHASEKVSYVICSGCRAQCGYSRTGEAVAEWNKRTKPTESKG